MSLAYRKLVNIAISVVVLTLAAPAQSQQEDELKEVRNKIQQSQQRIDQQLKEAGRLQGILRKAELDISSTAKQLNETQIALENNRFEQTKLREQQQDLLKQVEEQRGALAEQIKSAFMAGHYDYIKMLFNQEDAGAFERVLSYYQYLNKARQAQIDSFRELVAQLKQVESDIDVRLAELSELEATQQAQRKTLLAQQETRKKTLALLEKSIQSEAARVEQLQLNEKSLLQAIEEAQRRQQAPALGQLSGLAKLKGKLLQPTKGRMQRLFGKRRQGQVRWKGVLISGNGGSPVRAIHDAKVLYSDWLRGFGLVTVLDHGDGYMSLYGHNQALLKQAGDLVRAGETIALVGQSGGQTSPNLYFEIRHKGRAINPSGWIKR